MLVLVDDAVSRPWAETSATAVSSTPPLTADLAPPAPASMVEKLAEVVL